MGASRGESVRAHHKAIPDRVRKLDDPRMGMTVIVRGRNTVLSTKDSSLEEKRDALRLAFCLADGFTMDRTRK